MIDGLPYASLDVMFNQKNVWANRQNHHPALIMYDMDEPLHWSPYFSDESVGRLIAAAERAEHGAGGSPSKRGGDSAGRDDGDEEKEDKPSARSAAPGGISSRKLRRLAIQSIDLDVVVPPAIKLPIVDRITQDLLSEMKENMRLVRAKKGLDCYFDERPVLMAQLDHYLQLCEKRVATLDPDFCPKQLRFPCAVNSKDGSEFPPSEETVTKYSQSGAREWRKWHIAHEKFITQMREDFPVKKGKKFRAFPIHFSTADIELIRNYLNDSSEYLEMISWGDDSVVYCLQVHIFPLIGGILSVWLMVGTQTPIDVDFFE